MCGLGKIWPCTQKLTAFKLLIFIGDSTASASVVGATCTQDYIIIPGI